MGAEQVAIVTEKDLLSRVTDTEHQFIERKTMANTDGWLKTAVAFANSCPIGQPGILYINVDDKGEVLSAPPNTNFENFQKTVSKVISGAWPAIYFTTHILQKDGRTFVAVVVFGSEHRPHFAGRAYVRVGPENRDATEEQYDDLIAQRSSKYRWLKRLEGQQVVWHSLGYMPGDGTAVLTEVNQAYLTIEGDSGGKYRRHFPIEWVTLTADGETPKLVVISTQ
jgi:Putative DNA-binding domain